MIVIVGIVFLVGMLLCYWLNNNFILFDGKKKKRIYNDKIEER